MEKFTKATMAIKNTKLPLGGIKNWSLNMFMTGKAGKKSTQKL